MSEELNTAFKIATAACVMAALLCIGLTIMLIGRNLWNKTAEQVTTPINSVVDSDAFYLASYEKPVPVADIWKLVARINSDATVSGNGNISSFQIKERSTVNPNDWVLVSTTVTALDTYMHRKGYISWEVDNMTGLYSMEVFLT